ncbi:interferon-induced very large GTPase 1-like isoform X2 [Mya arenaria]|uniref:interferon-induced very large GTPase 1-like isoform X2 n=1 Tax=Mya arenaria TaxID=6604 RepID=UPI0022DF4E7C|nr:interferon-induced very large GTPase 1-like isoform X2 [Mya arenaria]
MGVDIETYRGRIGCFKGSIGCDVVTIPCNVNFSSGMKTIGAVVFIGLLLIIGGIEPNPGPPHKEVTYQRLLKEKIQENTECTYMISIAVAISVLLLYMLDYHVFVFLCLLSLASVVFLKRNCSPKKDDKEKGTSNLNKNSETATSTVSSSTVVAATTTTARVSTDDGHSIASTEGTSHAKKEDEDAKNTIISRTAIATPTPVSVPAADVPTKEGTSNLNKDDQAATDTVTSLTSIATTTIARVPSDDGHSIASTEEDEDAKNKIISRTAIATPTPIGVPAADRPTKEGTSNLNKNSENATSTVSSSTAVAATTTTARVSTDDGHSIASTEGTSHAKKEDEDAKNTIISRTAIATPTPVSVPAADVPTKEGTSNLNKNGENATSTVSSSTVVAATTTTARVSTDDGHSIASTEGTSHAKQEDEDAKNTIISRTAIATPTPESVPAADVPTKEGTSNLNKNSETATSTVSSSTVVAATTTTARVSTDDGHSIASTEGTSHAKKEDEDAKNTIISRTAIATPTPVSVPAADVPTKEGTSNLNKDDQAATDTVTSLSSIATTTIARVPSDDGHSIASTEDEDAKNKIISRTAIATPTPIGVPAADRPTKEGTSNLNKNSENATSTVSSSTAVAATTTTARVSTDDGHSIASTEGTSHAKKEDEDAKNTIISRTAIATPTPVSVPAADVPTKEGTSNLNKNSETATSTVSSSTVVAATTTTARVSTDDGHSIASTEGSDVDDPLVFILCRLKILDKFPEKISTLEVVRVEFSSSTNDSESDLVHAPYTLLRNIISVNCDARDSFPNVSQNEKDLNNRCKDLDTSYDDSDMSSDDEELSHARTVLSPLDIFHAVLSCCDPMLKQILYRKLYLCKIALPFITNLTKSKEYRLEIWPLRTLDIFDSKTKRDENVLTIKSHFLTFARLGRPQFSKSRLLNCLISGTSNAFSTFYNKESPSGNAQRRLTKGLVEAFWLQTTVKTSVSPNTVAFFNVRGEIEEFDHKALSLIQTLNDCLILIPDPNVFETKLLEMESYLLGFKHIVFIFPERQNSSTKKTFRKFKTTASAANTDVFAVNSQGGSNFFDIVSSLSKRLFSVLESCTTNTLESKLKVAKIIPSDEDNALNVNGKSLAENVIKCIHSDMETLRQVQGKGVTIKTCITPVSSIETKKLADCLKDIQREQSKAKQNELNEKKKVLMDNRVNLITQSVKCFLQNLQKTSSNKLLRKFFIGWVQIELNKMTSDIIQTLKEIKLKEQGKYLDMKKSAQVDNDTLKQQQQIMVQSIEDLENSRFGVEYIFREISHVYDTVIELKRSKLPKDLPPVADVARIFAEFIIEGEAFEIIDGDSMFMAKNWLKTITNVADTTLKCSPVASLSVLGLQSSGKSTLLNTMFGVQFSVNSGRCTKGVNALVLPIERNEKDVPPFEYVMIVDSEGLRAPELENIGAKSDRDNALATFVTGMGDLTLMNIMGENFTDMRDILQIIVHALLRLKLANSRIRIGQACGFVHHNVTDKSARDNMREGFLKLVHILDSVAKEAANAEGISDVSRFNEVIKFNTDDNVFHIPNLWQGIIPMNRINTDYSDAVISMRTSILQIIAGVKGKAFGRLNDFIVNAEDLWKGILVENFVFSFRNSLEIKAYCTLEEQIHKIVWDSELKVKEYIMNSIQKSFATCNQRQSLKHAKENILVDFKLYFDTKKEDVTQKVYLIFEKHEYAHIVIQWKSTSLINTNHRFDMLERAMKAAIENSYQRRVIFIETSTLSKEKKDKLHEESLVLAKSLQDKEEVDENTIITRFKQLWQTFMETFESENPPTPSTSLESIFLEYMFELHHTHRPLLQNSLDRMEKKKKSCQHLAYNQCGITHEDVSLKIRFKFWEQATIEETMPIVKDKVNDFLENADDAVSRLMQCLDEITISKAKEYVFAMWDDLKGLNKCKDMKFTFKKTALIKIHVYVCGYAYPLFQDHNEKFEKEHGTVAKLNKFQKDMYISFYDNVKNRRSEETAAKMFCSGLQSSVNTIIQTKLYSKVQGVLGQYLPNLKHVLLREICISLAENDEFKIFQKYLRDPEGYASLWYKEKGDNILFSKGKYFSIAHNLISQMTEDVEIALRKLRLRYMHEAKVDGSSIFDYICDNLQNYKLEITDFDSFRDKKVVIEDIDYFAGILLGENGYLKSHINAVSSSFCAVTEKTVKWVVDPYNLFEAIWGCKSKCPFCREPCAIGTANHEDTNHYCFQHRIPCCTGVHKKDSKKASISVCNFNIQSHKTFSCSFIGGDCTKKENGDCEEHSYPYKEYKKYFLNWDIPPSSTEQDSSKFWLWFVNQHKKSLGEYYKIDMSSVPSSWSDILKEEAIQSLDRYSVSSVSQ